MSKVLLALGGYALFVIAVFFAIRTYLDLQSAKQEAADAAKHRAIWQARYSEVLSTQRTKIVNVTKWATRYDTLRALITDTVVAVPNSGTTVPTLGSVPGYPNLLTLIEAADSTIAACRELVTSCERFRITADSTLAATRREATAYKTLWEKERPSWKARFGISCGYSLSKIGADIKAGPTCGATFRVWP